MKPFKIKKNSWHYKLNANFMQYNFMDRWEYYHSGFCSYWRATIGRLILAAFMIVVGVLWGCVLGLAFYLDPVTSLSVVGAAILLIGAVTFFARFRTRNHHKPSKPDSLFMQKYKAHKAKICPMVEYENK